MPPGYPPKHLMQTSQLAGQVSCYDHLLAPIQAQFELNQKFCVIISQVVMALLDQSCLVTCFVAVESMLWCESGITALFLEKV